MTEFFEDFLCHLPGKQVESRYFYPLKGEALLTGQHDFCEARIGRDKKGTGLFYFWVFLIFKQLALWSEGEG